jgi:hypothetical protein
MIVFPFSAVSKPARSAWAVGMGGRHGRSAWAVGKADRPDDGQGLAPLAGEMRVGEEERHIAEMIGAEMRDHHGFDGFAALPSRFAATGDHEV